MKLSVKCKKAHRSLLFRCTEHLCALFFCECNNRNKIKVSNYISNANSRLMIPDNLVRSSLSKCQISCVMNSPMIINILTYTNII